MIPKIIHFMSSSGTLNVEQEKCIESFTKKNPELKPIHWTDDSIDRFIKGNYSKDFYHDWTHNVQGGSSKRGILKKWDSSRLYILNKMGGVWTDSDCTCLRPLDSLLNYDLVIRRPIYRYGPMFDEQYNFEYTPPHICNAFFSCSPDNNTINKIISEIAVRFREDPLQNVGSATACLLYGEIVQKEIDENNLENTRLLEHHEFKEGPEKLEWIAEPKFKELFVVHKLGDNRKRYKSFLNKETIAKARSLY